MDGRVELQKVCVGFMSLIHCPFSPERGRAGYRERQETKREIEEPEKERDGGTRERELAPAFWHLFKI